MSDVYLADVQANPGTCRPTPAIVVALPTASPTEIIGVCISVQGAPTWDAAGAGSDFSANAGLTEIRPMRYLAALIATVTSPS